MTRSLIALLIATCWCICPAHAQEGEGSTSLEVFFPKQRLLDMLAQEDCTGIRFYHMMPSNSGIGPSLMAMAITTDGTELYNGWRGIGKYQVYEGIDPSGEAMINTLSRNNAAEAVDRLVQQGHAKFCASFSAAELQDLLAPGPSTGIAISTRSHGLGDVTLAARSGSLSEGRIGYLEDVDERICGEPCPSFCGPPTNYVWTER